MLALFNVLIMHLRVPSVDDAIPKMLAHHLTKDVFLGGHLGDKCQACLCRLQLSSILGFNPKAEKVFAHFVFVF